MEIDNHRLTGQGVVFEQTENFWSGPFKTSTGLPDSIILHYTAMTDFQAAVNVLKTRKPENNASAHLVIGKKGEIVQLARFDQRTWHAGVSSYNGRESYNHYSIGIEIDNAGWLQDMGNGEYSRKLLQHFWSLDEKNDGECDERNYDEGAQPLHDIPISA